MDSSAKKKKVTFSENVEMKVFVVKKDSNAKKKKVRFSENVETIPTYSYSNENEFVVKMDSCAKKKKVTFSENVETIPAYSYSNENECVAPVKQRGSPQQMDSSSKKKKLAFSENNKKKPTFSGNLNKSKLVAAVKQKEPTGPHETLRESVDKFRVDDAVGHLKFANAGHSSEQKSSSATSPNQVTMISFLENQVGELLRLYNEMDRYSRRYFEPYGQGKNVPIRHSARFLERYRQGKTYQCFSNQ